MYTSSEGFAGAVMSLWKPLTVSPARIEASRRHRKSTIGNSAFPFAGRLEKRILFSTFEAGMYMKTNKTRTN
jgi:hypothetical protein